MPSTDRKLELKAKDIDGSDRLTAGCVLTQCFSTAEPRSGTGNWHQLYRAARGKFLIVEIF
jgi:hypothetical protein